MQTARFLSSLFLMGASALAQAAPAGEHALPLQKVFADSRCGTDTASVRTLSDAPSVVKAAQCDALPGTAPLSVPVDFSSHVVMQVCMGQQSSAGSTLDVIRATQHRRKKRLTLHARWSPPNPKLMHAAVMSWPCVYVALPKGDYRSVRVRDAAGKIVLQSSLN
jgi:hypothetical protein